MTKYNNVLTITPCAELPLKPELERALSFEHGTKLNRGMSVMSNESVVKVGKSSVENEVNKNNYYTFS